MTTGIISYVRILEKKPGNVTVRRWREIRRAAMKEIGEQWHAEMLPDHFKPNAKYVYHYKRRTKKHEERKERAARRGRSGRRLVDPRAGTDSLTFSGTLRDNVTRVAHIRQFEQRFKLVMPGTPYTPSRPRRPNQPWLAAEITKVLVREKKVLARTAKSIARTMLNASKPPRTRRIS